MLEECEERQTELCRELGAARGQVLNSLEILNHKYILQARQASTAARLLAEQLVARDKLYWQFLHRLLATPTSASPPTLPQPLTRPPVTNNI